ncbi:MAG: ribonuclease Z [Myxococcota bacterium]|jgi:ribonuclease Z
MNARLILYVILSIVMAVSWASSCVIYRAAEIGELVGPMDDQYFGNLKAVVVGSGNGFENPERMGPSIAIGWDERLVLVDAGRGIAESMRAARLPLAQAEAVLLTSLLPENTVGLDDLFLTGWRQPRTKPLRVYGPPGTEAFCEALVAAHAIGIAAEGAGRGLPPEGGVLIGHDINPGWTADLDGLEITTADLPGGPTPALAWRFDRDGRSLVVVGAGWAPEAVVEFAADANFLFHEGVIIPPAEDAEEAGIMIDPELLRLEAKLHTPLIDVGSIASRANVDNVVLVRLRPPPFYNFQVTGSVQQSYDGGIHIASDGDEIEPPRR